MSSILKWLGDAMRCARGDANQDSFYAGLQGVAAPDVWEACSTDARAIYDEAPSNCSSILEARRSRCLSSRIDGSKSWNDSARAVRGHRKGPQCCDREERQGILCLAGLVGDHEIHEPISTATHGLLYRLGSGTTTGPASLVGIGSITTVVGHWPAHCKKDLREVVG